MTNTFVRSPQILRADTVYPTSPVNSPGAGSVYTNTDYIGGSPRIVRSKIGDSGQLGIAATQASTVVNRLIRVPDNIIISKLEAWIDIPSGVTVSTAAFMFGLYYSDRPGDVPAQLASIVNVSNAISDSFFAYQVDLHAQTTPLDITLNNASGNSVTDGYYTPGALEYQLWDAVMNGGADRTLVANATPTQSLYSQGKGYSSGSGNQWTAPYNGGTILPPTNAASAGQAAQQYPFGSPGCLVDICARPSSTVSATGAFTLYVRLTYLTPVAP